MPTVNVNGTSPRELIKQYLAVADKADELLITLRQAAPHGRDYPGDTQEYDTAAAWHRVLCKRVSIISDHYKQMALQVSHQMVASAGL